MKSRRILAGRPKSFCSTILPWRKCLNYVAHDAVRYHFAQLSLLAEIKKLAKVTK